MIPGMTPFVFIHVLISVIAILTGIVVVVGMVRGHRLNGWTAVFLGFTVATTVTGFFFPFHGLTPAIVTGIISAVLLAAAIPARYVFRLSTYWRWIFVATAVTALYLNCFVFVVQAFQKIPPLHALAPKGVEPPFDATQGFVLALFVVLGLFAIRRFHPATTA